MKKGPSESTRNPGNTTHRRRKYGEEFKLQALAMQSQRSVAEALVISENLIHFISESL
jgi:transposase-like protein